jgi:integrase
MHDLRHTFATIMLNGGEDLVAVQRFLGHGKVSFTADLYVGARSECAEASGAPLRRPTQSQRRDWLIRRC